MKLNTFFLLLLVSIQSSCTTERSELYANTIIRDDSELSLIILTPGLDSPPRIKRGKFPVHPIWQRTKAGSAVVEFTIDNKGRTSDLVTIEKEGEGFAGNTKYAIRYWRFEPAMKKGEPVECRVRYGIKFHGL